jgi:acyl-CoA synthetase (NDP forming)
MNWITAARNEGRIVLTELESKELVAGYRIPIVPTRLATTPDEAAAMGLGMGYPVAVKLLSRDISHKSDVGGVRIGLGDDASVFAAFGELQSICRQSGARFDGVTVQPMAPAGVELLLGAYRDPQFGPVVTFGLGGVFAEALDDVVVRVAPVSLDDALEMLGEIRGQRVLGEFRGRPAIDRQAVARAIVQLSTLMLDRAEVAELDLNPVLAYSHGLLAVDARVVLVPAA